MFFLSIGGYVFFSQSPTQNVGWKLPWLFLCFFTGINFFTIDIWSLLEGCNIEGNYAEVALVENLLRQDLTPVEEAETMQTLMTRQQYTQDQLGATIGKAQNTLSEILSINRLPQEVRDDCRGNRTISRSALIAIAKKKQARAMVSGYTAVKAKLEKGKTTRKNKQTETAQTAIDAIAKFQQKITALDTANWTDAGKADFQKALENFKAEIDNATAAMSAPVQATTATTSTRKSSSSKKTVELAV
jgi:ParB family chromosome partitioning protein